MFFFIYSLYKQTAFVIQAGNATHITCFCVFLVWGEFENVMLAIRVIGSINDFEYKVVVSHNLVVFFGSINDSAQ